MLPSIFQNNFSRAPKIGSEVKMAAMPQVYRIES